MADKRTPPDSFPLALQAEPIHRELVKQHWNATFARQGRMSVAAKRIMARVLDQIRDDEFALRPYYQLRAEDVTDSAGVGRRAARQEIEDALRELTRVTWEMRDANEPDPYQAAWQIRHLLDTTKEIAVGYQGGVITVLLNPQLAPYFIQAAHYSTYQLDQYMRLSSWYSMRFAEILSAFRDTGFWEVDLDEYRHLMDCGPLLDKKGKPQKDKAGNLLVKYPQISDLLTRTMTEPLAELADTDLAFTFTPLYEENRVGRGRKKIVRLRFELLQQPLTGIPATWLTHPDTAPVVAQLRKWKVTDKNIARYAPILGRSDARKLLREWEIKQLSDKRIDSLEKYCNAAFVRAAKAKQEQERAEALAVPAPLPSGEPAPGA